MRNIFIIGSKGIPAKYGGFETFVDQLIAGQKNRSIKYHVSCLGSTEREFEHNGARCFEVSVPKVGPASAVLYDVLALRQSIAYIRKHNLASTSAIYLCACRIGPFLGYYSRVLKRMGVKLYNNPDGHEWKRAKWNKAIKLYWKISERMTIAKADHVFCDAKGIEAYVREDYKKYNPSTSYIGYGATISETRLASDDPKLAGWYQKHRITPGEFYLIVGRFVPENNYELMLSEFTRSNTKKDLVIISNVEKNKFYRKLQEKTNFEQDKRIKFVGTVYDAELLTTIREQAFGYLHGHEVGGTNPSLLEAMALTKVNLLLEVIFNREVGEEGAMYYTKQPGSLASLISAADLLSREEVDALGLAAKRRMSQHYNWPAVVEQYERDFLGDIGSAKQTHATYSAQQGVLKR